MAGLRAARRVFDRTPSGNPKPATYGPWHVRDDASGFTLCGQGLRGGSAAPYEDRATDVTPAGPLCQRCWDRLSGRPKPSTPRHSPLHPKDPSA